MTVKVEIGEDQVFLQWMRAVCRRSAEHRNKKGSHFYLSQDGAQRGSGGRLSRPHDGPDYIAGVHLLHDLGGLGDLRHLKSASASTANPSTEKREKKQKQMSRS